MVTIEQLRTLALSFPETMEEPHFGKVSFRVRKKIFVTYDDKHRIASIKLSEIDQDVFASISESSIYPVPNKWGKRGWTLMELQRVNNELFIDAVVNAYCEVAPKKLAQDLRSKYHRGA